MENSPVRPIEDDLEPGHALGFTGAYRDPVTASYPLGKGYRWYMPDLMRFNAPDTLSPFGAGGLNPYTYCGGDPVNRADPTGHMFNPEEGIEDATRAASRSATDTSDSLAVSRAITAASDNPTPSTSHELVPTHFSVPSATSSSAMPKTYVPVVETWHPAFASKGIMMVEKDSIQLGEYVVTSHYTNDSPAEIISKGGIKAPDPDSADDTLWFTDMTYEAGGGPYVRSFMPTDIHRRPPDAAGIYQYQYHVISRPDDLALWKLNRRSGEDLVVLRHRIIDIRDVAAVYDRLSPSGHQPMPGFNNTDNVPLPQGLQDLLRRSIGGAR